MKDDDITQDLDKDLSLNGSVGQIVGASTNPIRIITYKKSVKKIVKVASATIPLQFIKVAPFFLGSVILSHDGTINRDSAILINSFEDFTRNVMNAPLYYVQTAVGKLNNNQDREKIGQIAQAGWLFAIIVSIPQIVVLVFSKPILNLIGEDPIITNEVSNFFKIYAICMPLLSLQLVSDQVTLGTKKIYFPPAIWGCGLVTYASLVYPLTFGLWGLPKLGILGSAFAHLGRVGTYTLLSYSSLGVLSRPKQMFSPFNLFKWDKKEFSTAFKQVVIKGIPLIFIISSEIGIMYVTNMLITRLSDRFLTPQLIISQYQDILLIPTWAFASAAQKEISSNIKNKKQNIMRLGNVSIGLSLVLPLVYGSFVLFSPKTLMAPFIDPYHVDNQDVVDILIKDKLLPISAACIFLLDLRYLTTQALMGADKTGLKLILNMLLTWLGIAIGAGINYSEQCDGILSYNLGLMIGFLISAIAQTTYWIYSAQNNHLERVDVEKQKFLMSHLEEHQEEVNEVPEEQRKNSLHAENKLAKSIRTVITSNFSLFSHKATKPETDEISQIDKDKINLIL